MSDLIRAAEKFANKEDHSCDLPVYTRLNIHQIAVRHGFIAGAKWNAWRPHTPSFVAGCCAASGITAQLAGQGDWWIWLIGAAATGIVMAWKQAGHEIKEGS